MQEEDEGPTVRPQMDARKKYHVMEIPPFTVDVTATPPVILSDAVLKSEYKIIVGKVISQEKSKQQLPQATPKPAVKIPEEIILPPTKKYAPGPQVEAAAEMSLAILGTKAAEAKQQIASTSGVVGMMDEERDLNSHIAKNPFLKSILTAQKALIATGQYATAYSLKIADLALASNLFKEIMDFSNIPRPIGIYESIMPSRATTQQFMEGNNDDMVFGINTSKSPIRVGWWLQPLVYIDKCYRGIMTVKFSDHGHLVASLVTAAIKHFRTLSSYVDVGAKSKNKIAPKGIHFHVHRSVIESWAATVLGDLVKKGIEGIPNSNWIQIWDIVGKSTPETPLTLELLDMLVSAMNIVKKVAPGNADMYSNMLFDFSFIDDIDVALRSLLGRLGKLDQITGEAFVSMSDYISHLKLVMQNPSVNARDIEIMTFSEYTATRTIEHPLLVYTYKTTDWYKRASPKLTTKK